MSKANRNGYHLKQDIGGCFSAISIRAVMFGHGLTAGLNQKKFKRAERGTPIITGTPIASAKQQAPVILLKLGSLLCPAGSTSKPEFR